MTFTKFVREDSNGYHKSVDDYLAELGVTVDIKPARKQDCPERCSEYTYINQKTRDRQTLPHNHGHKYQILLKRKDKRDILLDAWWNSFNSRFIPNKLSSWNTPLREIAADSNKSIPSAYDMLSSFSTGFFTNQETFEEYCGNFGENTDSRKALEFYQDAVKTAILFQRMFTEEELQKLGELAS